MKDNQFSTPRKVTDCTVLTDAAQLSDEQRKTDEQYMQKALTEARAAGMQGEVPIGAIIVCGNRIIARAHNLTELLHDVTAHAEMQAITSAANELQGKYLTDCTLYVTVEPSSMALPTRNAAIAPMLLKPCIPKPSSWEEFLKKNAAN